MGIHLKNNPVRVVFWLAVLAFLSAGTLSVANADMSDAANFYKGKTIKLVVGYGPGGGFDTYARLIAPHLEKAMGATVIVENRPGGGLTALNQIVRAKADGLRLMLAHGEAAVLAQLIDKPGVRFDLTKVTWLGRVRWGAAIALVKR